MRFMVRYRDPAFIPVEFAKSYLMLAFTKSERVPLVLLHMFTRFELWIILEG